MHFAEREAKRRIGIIVASSEHEGTLGKTNVRTYVNRDKIVDPYLFADPYIVVDDKTPRMFDVYSRLNDKSLPDMCAKDP